MQSPNAGSGSKLHSRMRALVKEKKARLMGTSIVTTRSGQKGTVESICEYISRCEYNPPGYVPLPVPEKTNVRLRPECPTAF